MISLSYSLHHNDDDDDDIDDADDDDDDDDDDDADENDLWVMSTPVIPFTIAGNEFMMSKTSPVICKA